MTIRVTEEMLEAGAKDVDEIDYCKTTGILNNQAIALAAAYRAMAELDPERPTDEQNRKLKSWLAAQGITMTEAAPKP